MKKTIIIITFIFFLLPAVSSAENFGEKLSGRILLDVEGNGEAWYVYPKDLKRYYLGRPDDAFAVMRELGFGISEINFQKIAQAGMGAEGNLALAKMLSGLIVLQVEKNGEAWYINPVDLKKYYLGRPDDAFRIMREFSLGIKKSDLALIHKPGTNESLDRYSSYKFKEKISTAAGDFYVDVIEIDLNDPRLSIITDTAQDFNCKINCTAKRLVDFAASNKAFAAMNGTYFNTSAAKRNYYFFPVFNSDLNKMINEDQLKYWTTGPIMAFDENNKFYYFKDSREFGGVENFENTYGVKLQAAIGNKPRLVENGKNLLIDWELDEGQRTTKTLRNALAYKKGRGLGTVYLVIGRNMTVPDLAEVMKEMEVDYALNMDGGNSSALFYNDEIMVGPGRDIPNAVMFSVK